MTNAIDKLLYGRYERSGLHVLVPKKLRVVSEAPQFYARGRKQHGSIVIDMNLDDAAIEGCEMMLRGPYMGDEMTEAWIVRQGEISVPYKGWESIVQMRDRKDGGNVNFGWLLTLYPPNALPLFVDTGAFITFEEAEALWTPVIESIRVSAPE